VRGKTLGIVGYGHIGTQVGVLAEALGMHVIFHDIETKLTLGNARAAATWTTAGGVRRGHPARAGDAATSGMIGAAQIAKMKPGAHLINASRGTVVDIDALAAALQSGHIGGAAVDVFPENRRAMTIRFGLAAARHRQRDPHPARRRQHAGSAGQHRHRGGGQAGALQRQRQHPVVR
jgi:phosphoglycerate dehydrogenase-like enzyme